MDKLFFDLETTGPDATKDRIIELAIRVVNEDGETLVRKSKRYNPGIKISKQATEVHGIKDNDVRDEPLFKEDAKKLKKLFENKVIITYNGMVFDIPILMNEFERAGVEVNLSGIFIDVLKVERKLAPHTLSNTYKKYTGNDLDGAHGALVDVDATKTVMEHHIALLRENSDGNADTENELIKMSGTEGMADYYGKLKYDSEGFLVFNFGAKCKGKRVVDEASYAKWILSENFPAQVKKLIRDEQTKGLTKRIPKYEVSEKGWTQEELNAHKSKTQGFRPVQTEAFAAIDDLPF